MSRTRVSDFVPQLARITSSVILLALGPPTCLHAQTPQSTSPQQAAHAGHAPTVRIFASDAGMVLNFVKPDKTADFEAIMGKLKEALQKSEKPERKQQAASWKVLKALEPGVNGSVVYVFLIDPPVKGVDYTVSTILAEAFPNEVQSLYKEYVEAYATGQNVVNLTLVSALGH